MKLDIQKHDLVPVHEILSEKEKEEFIENLEYDEENLPKILLRDPVVKEIGAKEGDILRITRESKTAGMFVTYRLVVDRDSD
ncbi:DNA-directed RNA polymerase subunit H [Methanobrevibacter sp. 87.7]|uniref:DNA-directed RNA polymerase subunit H n=1 Tax=Methanobrevibacter sp. 87.7 TaxID=387957 RepID=UPI000B50C8E2|nr:DNA-directed RNA polymerase subunit H [Methanobrevibacter sp. 87.7]OWT33877.1 DNA-directed RNA polymerase subunit H [Methanobrevibacter sp. 87.7]